MTKNFTQWNTQKQKIHDVGTSKFYHVREVWWCALGVNVGSEQDGGGEEYRRPVVILKALGPTTCLVVPLTTSTHTHQYRLPIGEVNDENATALLSQIRVVDTKRLVRKVDVISKETFEHIRKAARDML